MPGKRSNLGCHTLGEKAMRRIANQTEVKRASANERKHAEEAGDRHIVRLKDERQWRKNKQKMQHSELLYRLMIRQNEDNHILKCRFTNILLVCALLDVLSRIIGENFSRAHILIWLYDKITSNEIDDVICVESSSRRRRR
ncbi:unnamed protein product [Onchocerca flexuosa]|uniref:IBB domain-containing protein n=1 Tax=Onchocerca flexuosa TaxID=387005 RepID=A0A183GYZ7_9BILA|nr:unnamed protein product [Onchocerca flexuosa]